MIKAIPHTNPVRYFSDAPLGSLSALSRESPGAVVVFDDCPGGEVLDPYLDAATDIRVIVVARSIDWIESRRLRWRISHLELQPFDQAASEQLLRAILPEADPSERMRLISEIGGHPLLLNLVAHQAATRSVEGVLSEFEALRSIASSEPGLASGSYYLDTNDMNVIREFEAAWVGFLEALDRSPDLLPPERGSWFRRFRERVDDDKFQEDALNRAERAAEVRALTGPEGEANRNNAEAVALLLEATQAIPNLVVNAGSVLLIKATNDGGPQVWAKTLTATELRAFEVSQHLMNSPTAALEYLGLLGPGGEPTQLNSGAPEIAGPDEPDPDDSID